MIKPSTFASLMDNMTRDQVTTLIQEKIILSEKPESIIKKPFVNSLTQLEVITRPYPVHILYAIDPYDVVTYCYPLGFSMQNRPEGSELDKLSDKLMAWDKFFEKRATIFLLDEHRSEMARLRNRMLMVLEQQIEEYEEFEKVVQNIYLNNDNTVLNAEQTASLSIEIWEKRLPWLAAAGTGELHNSAKRFSNILQKLTYRIDQISKKAVAPFVQEDDLDLHVETIKEVFSNTPASTEAFKNFRRRIDHLKDRAVDIDDRRQENLLVDYEVIDRILRINETFEILETKLKCRYVVLYLSSDQKSPSLARELDARCPKFYTRPFNLVRNISQYWLADLMSTDIDGAVQNLKKEEEDQEKLILNLATAYHIISENRASTSEEMSARVDVLRNRLEWHGLIKNMVSYPAQLKATFVDLETKSTFEPLKRAFNELVQKLNSTTGKQGLLTFEKEIRNVNIEITLLQKIVAVLNTDPTPDISSLGYVVGINHHLPTLFAKTVPVSKYEDMIDKTVDFILSPSKVHQFSGALKNLSKELRAILLQDDVPDIPLGSELETGEREMQFYERQMMLYLFSLLLPGEKLRKTVADGIREDTKAYFLDNELNDFLSVDIDTISKKITKYKQEGKSGAAENLAVARGNLLYVWLWSLRRNNRLEESDKLIDRIKNNDWHLGKDPDIRLKHGKALLSYSRLVERLEQEKPDKWGFYAADNLLKKLWKAAQRDAEDAFGAYEGFQNTDFPEVFLAKARSAMLNTLIYIYVVGYAINKESSRLATARKMLEENKADFQEDRRHNPEYIHTEANLEYFEAHHHQAMDQDRARSKLEHAEKAINKCIDINAQFFPHKAKDPDYIGLRDSIQRFQTYLDGSLAD
jgi:hypothetical protein